MFCWKAPFTMRIMMEDLPTEASPHITTLNVLSGVPLNSWRHWNGIVLLYVQNADHPVANARLLLCCHLLLHQKHLPLVMVQWGSLRCVNWSASEQVQVGHGWCCSGTATGRGKSWVLGQIVNVHLIGPFEIKEMKGLSHSTVSIPFLHQEPMALFPIRRCVPCSTNHCHHPWACAKRDLQSRGHHCLARPGRKWPSRAVNMASNKCQMRAVDEAKWERLFCDQFIESPYSAAWSLRSSGPALLANSHLYREGACWHRWNQWNTFGCLDSRKPRHLIRKKSKTTI